MDSPMKNGDVPLQNGVVYQRLSGSCVKKFVELTTDVNVTQCLMIFLYVSILKQKNAVASGQVAAKTR